MPGVSATVVDKHPGGSVGVFGVGRNLVFNLDIAVFAELAKRAQTHRHAHQPLPEIELMRVLVEAARRRPSPFQVARQPPEL
ncbi:Uncharacterised protein [Enterobacter cancerogenus]|uniref:Uncharacterized protein n=1 Tax=Enterobacter cancerogenus TaxID=69218 RepID=A0A484XV98_9ENTR|nr:Uncharacterised protein [Enterobacter cancerogenus]